MSIISDNLRQLAHELENLPDDLLPKNGMPSLALAVRSVDDVHRAARYFHSRVRRTGSTTSTDVKVDGIFVWAYHAAPLETPRDSIIADYRGTES